jgi:hypothetical protein
VLTLPPVLLCAGDGEPSWCSDCEAAKPIIEETFAKITAPTTLIEVHLPRDEYKGNPSHWARVGPAKLQKVPTLYKWEGKRPGASLVEGQCTDRELMSELVLGD